VALCFVHGGELLAIVFVIVDQMNGIEAVRHV
jgi:hypothetical protein